jgi:hypothetical protein
MAFTESRFPPSEGHTDHVQDMIPPSERNQDPAETEMTDELTTQSARPLTEDERKAADRAPAEHTVYAPASERVPVDPVPGHREFVEHPDPHTREREAAAEREADAGNPSTTSSEPPFARVPRPSTTPPPDPDVSSTTTPSWGSSSADSAWNMNNDSHRGKWLGMSLGWLTVGVSSVAGVWLWLRWQRQRNKPINRVRRHARQAAEEIRERVPNPEDAARPAMGLTTAILSILLLWWQQSRSRARQADKVVSRQAHKAVRRADKAVSRASDAIPDVDWQKRLMKLKDRWTPGRVELEKISLSR